MKRGHTRRRFLSITAAAAVLSGLGAEGAVAQTAFWRGSALGAAASIRLAGLSHDGAQPIFRAMERELIRLENIFNLYRPDSELARLNEQGVLAYPSPELLEVLSLSARLNRATEGAFDPTVQPLFAASARAVAENRKPTEDEIAMARSLVGWDQVRFDQSEVRLEGRGVALTLNGIAQGYITDRIAALLKARGLTDVLVDFGEVVAVGRGENDRPWRVGISDTDGTIQKRILLTDRAIATSSPRGTLLDPAGQLGHIFDPTTGIAATSASVISVSAPRADLADGLSTALSLMSGSRRAKALDAFPGTSLEFDI
ncbi:FAD:protein FMN transferase [Silicimonas sp. MF1-12-2]|uniref:FAD:protein FMN transferase n=1 Tax=Silicimonas sp. MF1-12-2 TaxID=3384793 RepID=UPI0039B53FDD